MSNVFTISEIQDHPGAFSVSDDDLCATCQGCAYVPGQLSLCETQFKEPEDFTPQLSEDKYIIACEKHVTLNDNESNLVT